MSTKHTVLPPIEAIMEELEDGAKNGLKLSEHDPSSEVLEPSQAHVRLHDTEIRANAGKGKSKKNRSSGNKSARGKAKNLSQKRAPLGAPRDFDTSPQNRNRRNVSNRNMSTSSSSEREEEEVIDDPRTALARARLTSPSILSSITTLTAVTNKSSSSSGSNSTVTQSSVSKRSSLGKNAEAEDGPKSPAAPDPPSKFKFTDNDLPLQQEPDSDDDEEDEEEMMEHESDRHGGAEGERFPQGTSWPEPRALMETAYEEPALVNEPSNNTASASSSASSSFHGDDAFSERQAGHDTDRSTSPEQSELGGRKSQHVPHPPRASDEHSVKIASQMAAARHRQNSWGSSQHSEPSEVLQRSAQRNRVHSSNSSSRSQHQVSQRPLPRAEDLPVTGYELLATKLCTSGFDVDGGPRIKPIYRKFEALNHRLLLHLQDELSELEDQLQRIDTADTQSRWTDRHIVPASRRAGAQVGGELEWHKTDILGRIGFKLNQYNQALASFNSTQCLSSPNPVEIEDYREYLYTEQPITEIETHFLDPEEDLVSMARHEKKKRHHHRSNSIGSGSMVSSVVSHSATSSRPSTTQAPMLSLSPSTTLPVISKDTKNEGSVVPQASLPIVAGIISAIVLLPILFFLVVPNLLGRIIITILTALSATGCLSQTNLLDRNVLVSHEGLLCAGLYCAVMLVIAGVMSQDSL